MKIILIGHKSRQGKDTVAEILHEMLPHSQIIAFATPIKNIIAEALNMSIEELETNKNASNEFRDILIRFGNGKMKTYFGKDVWSEQALSRTKEKTKYLIISDFRFEDEFNFFKKLNYEIITLKIVRDSLPPKNKSDKNLESFVFDHTIYNYGTIDDLRLKTKQFIDNV